MLINLTFLRFRDVDDIHDMMDDIAEQQTIASEISDAISNPVSFRKLWKVRSGQRKKNPKITLINDDDSYELRTVFKDYSLGFYGQFVKRQYKISDTGRFVYVWVNGGVSIRIQQLV